MADVFNEHLSADVCDENGVFIGKAKAEGKFGDENILLFVDHSTMKGIRSSFVAVIENDVYGLITCQAEMLEFCESADFRHPYEVRVKINKILGVVQRRNEVKVKTSINTIFWTVDEETMKKADRARGAHVVYEGEIKDLSASGLFFKTEEELEVGQIVEFVFDRLEKPFSVFAEIVRVQETDDGVKGYGARFKKLPSAYQSGIRMYVYNIQVENRAKKSRTDG